MIFVKNMYVAFLLIFNAFVKIQKKEMANLQIMQDFSGVFQKISLPNLKMFLTLLNLKMQFSTLNYNFK